MPMFTQASQLRLAQRSPDVGNRITPEVLVERSVDAVEWADASDAIEVVNASMTSDGTIVNFVYAATLLADSEYEYIYRFSFPEREDNITTPQIAGAMVLINTTAEGDREWASYEIIGIPEGRLEVINPTGVVWPQLVSGDIVQVYGTWFI